MHTPPINTRPIIHMANHSTNVTAVDAYHCISAAVVCGCSSKNTLYDCNQCLTTESCPQPESSAPSGFP